MLLSHAATLNRIDAVGSQAFAPLLPRLGRMVSEYRLRRLDRRVAELMLTLDHAGVVDDFETARRPVRPASRLF